MSTVGELTPQQRDVLRRIGDGLTYKEVAAALGLSERRVKAIVADAKVALRAASVTQAAVRYDRAARKRKRPSVVAGQSALELV